MTTRDRHMDLTDFEADLRSRLDRLAADTQTSMPSAFDPDTVSITRLTPPEERKWTPRLVAAAAAVVVVVGLASLPRNGAKPDTETAATQPATPPSTPTATEASTVNTAPTPVAAPTSPVAKLTIFPVVGAQAQPGDFGSYSQIGSDDPQRVTALVARRDGTALTDGIQIDVVSQLPEFAGAAEAITIHGVAAEVYTEPGTPALRTVVLLETSSTVVQGAELPGRPTILVQGLDPVGFLQSAGADVISVVAVTQPAPGHPSFTLSFGSLPSGYELIVAPFESPRGTTNAQTGVNMTEIDGDGSLIEVSLMNPVPSYATAGTLTPVDINGVSGWISSTAGHAVIWEPVPGTFATVAGTPSSDQALAIARSVNFVDEATWQQFYAVAPPAFGNS